MRARTRAIEKKRGIEIKIKYFKPRPGETKEFSYDLRKIKEHLGYEPRRTIEDEIDQIIDYTIKSNSQYKIDIN